MSCLTWSILIGIHSVKCSTFLCGSILWYVSVFCITVHVGSPGSSVEPWPTHLVVLGSSPTKVGNKS